MEDKTRAKRQLEPENWHQCTRTCVQISVLIKLIPFEEEKHQHTFQIQSLHRSKEYQGRIIRNSQANKNENVLICSINPVGLIT